MRSSHALSLLLASAAGASSIVANLTSQTFYDFVTSNELSLISFIVDYCSHCHDLYPEFELAAQTLQSHNWPLGRVNCQQDKALCKAYSIPIYPTIRVFHGEDHSIYNGKRRADAMVSFMKRHSQPVITKLETAQEAAEFSVNDRVTVIGFFNDEKDGEAFKLLAEKKRDEHLFGFTSDEAFGSAEKVKKPAMVMYKGFDEGRAVYEGPFEAEEIADWTRLAGTPYIREIGVDLNHAGSQRVPLAILFASGQEQRDQLSRSLWSVAESRQEELLWIIVDPDKYPEYARRVSFDGAGPWPAFGIEDKPNDFKYAFSQRGSVADLSPAIIRRVVDDFLNKKLQSSGDLPGTKSAVQDAEEGLTELERLSEGRWKKAGKDEL